MARQWHIDNADALVVDGVRFELQQVQWRTLPGGSILSATMWIKSAVQNKDGLNIEAPLYLPGAYWTRYDAEGHLVTTQGVVFKERTWEYYGLAGYTPGGTKYPITTLSPWALSEVSGDVLAFNDLRINPDSPASAALYFDTDRAYIRSGFYVTVGVETHYQFYGLGI